jgi:hypothetical protein
MTTDDPKISRRYRELPREEPPRRVDDAILAAARRAVVSRPAPLVVPSGRRRWYFPLAAAAIIVLAVSVTIHVERQQLDAEVFEAATPPKAPPEEKLTQPEPPAEPASPRVFAPDPKLQRPPAPPAPQAEQSRQLPAQRDAVPAAPRGAPAPSAAPPPPAAAAEDRMLGKSQQAPATVPQAKPEAAKREALMREEARARASRESAAVSGAVGARLSAAHASPEQWLQGIADLRRQGRHDEADKALAEFRRVYPDYKISEAMLEKVEKR